jgi:hypothetical protein
MRTLLGTILLAVLLAGCGDKKPAEATPAAATPEATATAETTTRREDPDLAGYSQGVKDYYVEIHNEPTGDEETDIETEYHQPPRPAEAGLGETITLTGTNIGIRLEATVTKVDRVGSHTAVHVKLRNTGITVYEAPLQNATVTYPGGEPVPVAKGERESCSKNFDSDTLRIDVARTRTGCLVFPTDGDKTPERFQLALEIVPAGAGGIWNLG